MKKIEDWLKSNPGLSASIIKQIQIDAFEAGVLLASREVRQHSAGMEVVDGVKIFKFKGCMQQAILDAGAKRSKELQSVA